MKISKKVRVVLSINSILLIILFVVGFKLYQLDKELQIEPNSSVYQVISCEPYYDHTTKSTSYNIQYIGENGYESNTTIRKSKGTTIQRGDVNELIITQNGLDVQKTLILKELEEE